MFFCLVYLTFLDFLPHLVNILPKNSQIVTTDIFWAAMLTFYQNLFPFFLCFCISVFEAIWNILETAKKISQEKLLAQAHGFDADKRPCCFLAFEDRRH